MSPVVFVTCDTAVLVAAAAYVLLPMVPPELHLVLVPELRRRERHSG